MTSKRMLYVLSAVAALGLLVLIGKACDGGPGWALKGQSNASITFHGLTVDQDGKPLPGVTVEYQVDAYPKDWTFDTRDRDYERSRVSATSDVQGRFQFNATGCMLRRMNVVAPPGYRHFCEEYTGGITGRIIPTTAHYRVIAWSDMWWKPDPQNPAVYVFVKDGVREVAALPCTGGSWSGGGQRWTVQRPAWPHKPSLKDVVQKQPATAPIDGGTAGP